MANQVTDQGWRFIIKGEESPTLEISIYDVIGESRSIFGPEGGVTAKDVLNKLRGAPRAKEIVLRINSVGGLVDDAKAMVNLLQERADKGATIEARIDGIAASAASYLTTVADKVVMPENAFLMIHAARSGMHGTSKDMANAADVLTKVDDQLAVAYAGASSRRGKGKTKEDFLAIMAEGDTYFTASEAIEWGLADESTEAMKVAACALDLSKLDNVPEQLVALMPKESGSIDVTVNFVDNISEPARQATESLERLSAAMKAQQELTNTHPPAQPSPEPAAQPEVQEMTDKTLSQNILKILALSDDADEAAAVTAINRMKSNATVGAEVEKLLGISGMAAIGAVRSLLESKEKLEDMQADLCKVKASVARRDFESVRAEGLRDKKLTPATAKLYSERFEAAIESGDDGQSVVHDLTGFLRVAPRIASGGFNQPDPTDGGNSSALTWNGKTYADLKPIERHRLWKSDPDLFEMMKKDFQEHQAA